MHASVLCIYVTSESSDERSPDNVQNRRPVVCGGTRSNPMRSEPIDRKAVRSATGTQLCRAFRSQHNKRWSASEARSEDPTCASGINHGHARGAVGSRSRGTILEQSIVVGVNGLEPQLHLAWSIDVATLLRSDLLLVHCLEGSLDPEVLDPNEIPRHIARDVVARAVASALGNGVQAEPRLGEGFPGKALVELSRGARLLVIDSSHRSRHSHMHSSISMYCVRHAQCPVTIVPTHS